MDQLLRVHVELAALLECCEPGPPIVPTTVSFPEVQGLCGHYLSLIDLLRSAATLLITKVLASIGREKALNKGK